MARADLRQPALLDLVDDRRDRRARRASRRTRPGSLRSRRSRGDSPSATAAPRSRAAPSPRTSSSSSGLCRSTTSGGRRRSINSIRACVSGSDPGVGAGRGAVRAVLGRRRAGAMPGGYVNDSPGSQVEAGKLRLRSTPASFWRVPASSPSGLTTGTTAQAVSCRGNLLEQAPREQRRDRLLAVLGGRQQAGDRPVACGHEHAQRDPLAGAAVLGRPPAVEEVAGHRPTVPTRHAGLQSRHAHRSPRSPRPDRRRHRRDRRLLRAPRDAGRDVRRRQARAALRRPEDQPAPRPARSSSRMPATRSPGSADLCFLVDGSLDEVARALAAAGVADRARSGRAGGRGRRARVALRARPGRQPRGAVPGARPG